VKKIIHFIGKTYIYTQGSTIGAKITTIANITANNLVHIGLLSNLPLTYNNKLHMIIFFSAPRISSI